MQIDDLSEGTECEKLTVVNKWNNDKLTPFKYINKLELSDKLHCSSSNEIRALKLSSNKYQVYFVNPQKGWGLRALNNIKKNCKLFEYAGILEPDGEREEDDYIFSFPFVQQKLMIDAHQKGNLARFMNHSCAANCTTEIAFDGATDPLPHALIIAKRDIVEGEELTMDYGDEWWQIKMAKGMECNCWAPNCRYQRKEANNETCETIDAEEEATTSSSGNGHGIFSTRQTAKKSIIQTAKKSINIRNTGKKSITPTNTVAMMNHI